MNEKSNLREIFKGIAFHTNKGGVTQSQLIKYHDWQQHIVLTEKEVNFLISSLVQKDLIIAEGDKYYLKSNLVSEVPVTKSGEFSFSKSAWQKFFNNVEL